jgi:hypothetical protein
LARLIRISTYSERSSFFWRERKRWRYLVASGVLPPLDILHLEWRAGFLGGSYDHDKEAGDG